MMAKISSLHLLASKAMPIVCCKCGCHLLKGVTYTMDEKIWEKVSYNCEKVNQYE
jgi:hypothetical protein